MNRRFLALLLSLCMALQSLVPAVAGARVDESPTVAHCEEAMTHAAAETQVPENGHPCPHCDHDGASHAECTTHCVFPVALICSPSAVALPTGLIHIEAAALPVLTRFDIPPTPPPIG